MRILAVETAIGTASVATLENGVALAAVGDAEQSKQAETLLPLIDNVIIESGWQYDSPDLLLATTGPGSFTGLRIGMAALLGIAIATSTKTSGISTLATLAHQARNENGTPILSIINAMRGQAYVQPYTSDGITATDAPSLLSIDELRNKISINTSYTTVCNSDELASALNIQKALVLHPNAEITGKAAYARLQTGQPLDAMTPLYIRSPDAKAQPRASL